MIIYANMVPLFFVTMLVGALYMAYFVRHVRRDLAIQPDALTNNGIAARLARQSTGTVMGLGALAGAAVGFVGPLIFMVPLQSCTFEPERSPLDTGVGVLLFAIGAVLLLAGARTLWRLLLDQDTYAALTAEQSTLGVFKVGWWAPALLLLPTLIILVVFLYYPLIDTFRLSTLLVRLGAPRTIFRCVDNFTGLLNEEGFNTTFLLLLLLAIAIYAAYRIFKTSLNLQRWSFLVFGIIVALALVLLAQTVSDDYGEVLFNTFFISTAIVVLGLVLGLIVAYLAYQPVRGAFIYRTLLIWPYAMSPAIAGIIFFVMFDPVAGVINHIIELFGGQGADWIRDPWLARFAVIITSVWKTLGYNILFYIAGLQTVPPDLVEAAAIDGANGWQRFRNIIVPALSPITFFLIVTNLTYAFFNIFGTIDFLTRGGPTGATSVAIYEVYQIGIRSKDLGGAAAQSLVLFIMVIGVTIFQFQTSGRRVTYGA